MQTAICAYTATSAAGTGLREMRNAIVQRKTGLGADDFPYCDIPTCVGRVGALETVSLPRRLKHFNCRNNLLAWHALQQDGLLDVVHALAGQVGSSRIGVVMGTSTSAIGRTEEAYRHLVASSRMPREYRQPKVHNLHSPGIFVAAATGITGPAITISTACSSSAKVFATAHRWILHGLIDAALVGGVDSLCLSTLYGFHSLQLISGEPCRPFDIRRDGINIGEAAGFAILTREDLAPDAELVLLGYGETSDAWHMSHPHPEGTGAVLAIDRALERAQLRPEAIDYINLHGTASKANDSVEALSLATRFPATTRASSTKGWTGHTLGTAGILEAVITMNSMQDGLVPGTLNCDHPDPELRFPVLQENIRQSVRHAMTNSFGFGGSNAVLIFGRVDA